jgi:glycosyltransferase involved in cell wall biosynthesis
MRIGIDARLLSMPLSGIGRYSHEMINALLRRGCALTLFSPAPLQHELEAGSGQYQVQAWRARNGRQRLFWDQFILPGWARRTRMDAFWGPAHRLPKGLARGAVRCVTIHDLVWKHAPHTMRPLSRIMDRHFMPIAVRRADCVVAVSEHTRADILQHWPSLQTPVHTIYPGVSQRAAPLPRAALARWGIGRPDCLFVGTLEPRKNLPRLLEAFAALPAAARHVQLVIAGGGGWGKLDLPDLIGQFGLSERVKLTGYVSEVELATLYAHAHGLVMPSLYEGFGLPLIEAMAHGVPLLTGALASMPEIAGGAAIVVDPYRTEAIAEGLTTLLLDGPRRQALIAAGQSRVARFDWDRAAGELLAVLEGTRAS